MMPPPGVPLPPGIVPPPAAPVVAPAADPAAAAPAEPAPAKESTTVYVGKIPPNVDDALVRKLLDACGEVRSWKRVMDPENDTPKRFGFCEFADAEGVLRAMRILDGFPVAGEELLLNVNQATKAYVEGYTEKRTVTAEEDARVDAERRAVLEAAVAAAGHAAEAEAFLAGALGAGAGAAAAPPNPPNPPPPLGGAFGAPKFIAARDPDSIAPPPPDAGAGGVEAPLSAPGSAQLAKKSAKEERARRDADPAALHRRDLISGAPFAATDDRASVAHATSGRCGGPCDKANDGLLHIRRDPLCSLLLCIPSNFADHDDRLGLIILVEGAEDVDEIGPVDRVPADSNARALPNPERAQLTDRLISERTRAAHDPD